MRILFITNYYPPHEVGGYEQLCRDVALRLEARGHTVVVLTSNRGVSKEKRVAELGVYRLLRIQPQYGTHLSPAVQFFLTRRKTEAYNRHTCYRVMEQFEPDVIFIWNLEGLPHELAVDAEVFAGAAVAYWLAGVGPAEPDSFWRYWTQAPGKRFALQNVKGWLSHVALAQMRCEGKPVRPQMRHVALVSEYMRSKGLAENTLPDHAEVIYNGVETNNFYRPVPSPDTLPPINLLVAGRVSTDKGVHVAVEAVGIAAQARSQRDFHLIVAGSGPADYLEYLQKLVSTQGCADLVSFLGRVPREQMPALMHRCHILLLPTVSQEPFARVTLEGMAAGLAVIGTLTGGTGELLQDSVNGLACAAEDSQDLARQIRRLLDDRQLRYRLASCGQKMVLTHYTLERMVERVEDLLVRAVAEQQQRKARS